MITDTYDHVWDCCCDHGLIGMSVLERDTTATVHFVDIVPELVDAVCDKLTITYPANSANHGQWKTHCINAKDLPLDDLEGKHLIIIAGVGGDETVSLVDALHKKFPTRDLDFILCPVYHQHALRQKLIASNFSLLNEALVKERKQFYEILHVSSNSKGQAISASGSAIWQTESTDELEVAKEYLERSLSHYRKSRRRLGDVADKVIADYEEVVVTMGTRSTKRFGTVA